LNSAIIVSADKELIKFLKDNLRDLGMSITGDYATGKAAMEAYKDASNDLVILDMFVPGSSGMEVLSSLKRMNDQGSFLLLSRLRTRLILEKAFRMGAQDILLVPVAPDIFRDTVLRRQAQQLQLDGEEQKAAPAAPQAQQAKPRS
jgi:two-component system, CitB family, response regulator MalR